MKNECPDCSISVCNCGNCHTMHCDAEQLCGYFKPYYKSYYNIYIDKTSSHARKIPPQKPEPTMIPLLQSPRRKENPNTIKNRIKKFLGLKHL